MKFTNTEIADLLKASYRPSMIDVGKFIIDKSISDKRMKVYTIPDSKDVIVIHRGSRDTIDWVDNIAHAFDVPLKLTATYNMHLRKQNKVIKKYGKENIICISHSRGGLYSTQFYKDGLAKQNITYNKPIGVHDILKNIFAKDKNDKNNIDIRTSGDISNLGNIIKGNKNNILIPSKTFDPIENHKIDRLKELPNELLIGNGKSIEVSEAVSEAISEAVNEAISEPISEQAIVNPNNKFTKQIDYKKIRVDELKAFLKPHRKALNINITGLTKKEMVKLVESLKLN